MPSWTTRCAFVLLLAAPVVLAQTPAHPAPAAAPPSSSPAAAEAPADPAADKILDRLQEAGARIKTFAAALHYDSINHVLDDKQTRLGTLVYVAGPPAGFAAHFNALIVDGKRMARDQTYIFDGKWLVEKNIEKEAGAGPDADRMLRQFKKTQTVAPNAPPQEANPLASGRGPFPLPINMNKAVILARYHVTLVSPGDPADPKDRDGRALDAIHLKLVPRPGPKVDFTEAHLWYLQDSLLPCKVRTLKVTEDGPEKESVVDLRDAQVNDPVDANALDTSEPREPGWDIEIQPWTQP
jgi:hypothetical protein